MSMVGCIKCTIFR